MGGSFTVSSQKGRSRPEFTASIRSQRRAFRMHTRILQAGTQPASLS
jgi:hypothetical protein